MNIGDLLGAVVQAGMAPSGNDRLRHSLGGPLFDQVGDRGGAHGAFPSALDSALRAATGNAIRTTLRASSVGQFGDPARTAATVTFAAEHSFVRDETVTQSAFAPIAPMREGSNDRHELLETRTNAGIIGQVNASFHETLFMTGGVRVERNTGLTGIGDIATLPMFGVSAIHSFGIGTLKLRTAYGKGIRPPQTSSRSGMLMGLTGSLSPEEQSGIEAGADAYITKPFSMNHLMLQINKLLEKREKLRKHFAGNTPTPENTKETFEIPDLDGQFLKRIELLVDQNMDNPNFSVDVFAQKANLGRTLFYKKIKYLTGYSPNEFIRKRKMKKAAELLITKQYNVSEVACMVGIDDQFYFSKCFKAEFGCPPSRFPEDYNPEK